jgi:hypothetical protein
MAKKRKAARQARTRRQVPIGLIIGVIIAVGLVSLIGYAIWASFQPEPQLGTAYPIASREHIQFGQQAVDYNTNPPTSGQHYDTPSAADFYDVAPADEFMVHSLEHGYVVLYYNCTDLSDAECEDLTAEIQTAMAQAGNSRNTGTPKIIAAPRPTMENLITITSWGRLIRAEAFDSAEFLAYVDLYRDQAPEPFAP